MKRSLPCLFVLCLNLGSYQAALGATLATVSADGGAFDAVGTPPVNGVQEVGKPLDCTPCSKSDPSPVSNRSSVDLTGDASFLGALALARASASAVPGHLGVSVQAGGSSSKDRQRAETSVTATAQWTSQVRFTAPGVPNGTVVTAHPILYLEGDFSGTATGAEASVSAILKIDDLGSFRGLPAPPYPGDSWGIFTATREGEVRDDVPAAVRMTRKFTVGEFGTIGFRFALLGFANSDSSTSDPFSSVKGTALVTADASRSLRWGGIESVTDSDGNLITDWSITSDDGFDYSQPFPMPEPTSILLLSTILGATAATTRRRG